MLLGRMLQRRGRALNSSGSGARCPMRMLGAVLVGPLRGVQSSTDWMCWPVAVLLDLQDRGPELTADMACRGIVQNNPTPPTGNRSGCT